MAPAGGKRLGKPRRKSALAPKDSGFRVAWATSIRTAPGSKVEWGAAPSSPS